MISNKKFSSRRHTTFLVFLTTWLRLQRHLLSRCNTIDLLLDDCKPLNTQLFQHWIFLSGLKQQFVKIHDSSLSTCWSALGSIFDENGLSHFLWSNICSSFSRIRPLQCIRPSETSVWRIQAYVAPCTFQARLYPYNKWIPKTLQKLDCTNTSIRRIKFIFR